jgi:hypothetical protein
VIPQADTLHTIAEVGIAVTGFAGIVAAVRAGATAAPRVQATDPLLQLLGTSLGTVLFCFVPEWLDAATASSDAVWRVALGLYGAYRLVYTGFLWRYAAPPKYLRWVGVVSAFVGVLQLVASAGFLPDLRFFLYLSGLLWGLVVALLIFGVVLSGADWERRAV